MPNVTFDIEAKNNTGSALSSVKGDLHEAGGAADEAGGHFAGLKEHLGKVAEVAAGMLGAEAAGGLANMFRGTMSAANDLGASVFALQQRIGGTAQDSSRLLFAFQEMGVQNPDRAIQSFSKSLQGLEEQADGTTVKSSKVTDQLKAMGVQVEDTAGKSRSMNDVMGDVADRFQHMPDGPEKTALALQLFGKAGADMIPMLDKGREGLAALGEESDKLGHTLTDKQVAAMRQNTLETEKLHAATEGLRIQLGVALLPVVTSGTELLTKMATAVVEHVLPATERFADLLGRTLGPPIGAVAEHIANLSRSLFYASEGFDSFEMVLGSAGKPLDFLRDGIAKLAEELDTHLKPVLKNDVIPIINQSISLFQTLEGGAISILITGIEYLVQNWDKLVQRFPLLGKAVDEVQPKLQQVADWLGKNIGPAIAQVVPMMQQFGTILQQNVAPILQTVFQWLGSHESVLMAIVGTAGIVGLVATIGAIPVALAAITAAVVALVTHWGEITEAVGKFADAVNTRFPEVGKFVGQVQTFFVGLYTFLSTQFLPGVETVISAVVGFIQDHWAGIKDLLSGPVSFAKDLIIGQLTLIKDVFSTVFTEIGDILQLFGDLFSGKWGKLWGDVQRILADAWAGMRQLVGDQLHTLENLLGDAWDTVKSVARQSWSEISKEVSDALHGLWAWIKSNWADILLDLILGPIWLFRDQIAGVIDAAGKNVASALGRVKDTIVGWAKDSATWLINAGESIITGLVQGFTNKFDDVKNTLGGLKDKIIGWKGPPEDDAVLLVNNGQLIIQGLQAGMESQYGAVEASLAAFGKTLVGQAQSTVSAVTQALSQAAQGVSGFASGLSPFGGGGSSGSITGDIQQAMKQAGVGSDWLQPLLFIAQHESSMDPSQVGHDPNDPNNNPTGLFQVKANIHGYTQSQLMDPVTNAYAAIEYILQRYGRPDNPAIIQGELAGIGYAGGGVINEPIAGVGLATGQRYRFGEVGPELVTPLTGGRGGGDTHVHVHLPSGGVSAVATDRTATGELVRAISKYLVSIGQPALVPGTK